MAVRAVVAGVGFPTLDAERSILEPDGIEVVDARRLEREQVMELFESADAVMVDYFPLDAPAIRRLHSCKVICQYGVGLDQIDIEAATARGIVVTHTPEYCVDELADHTLALMLASVRQIVRYANLVSSGEWDYNSGMPIRRLSTCTLGLVGFGNVAQAVARRAAGFGLRIIAVDPFVDASEMRRLSVEPSELDALLARSDVVSVHVPLNEATRHLIGPRELDLMPPGSYLINTARGGVVDQDALRVALESGHLRGCALDVLEREPPATDDPLLERSDVVLTPHAGFLSVESQKAVQVQAAEEVHRVLQGGRAHYAV
jgi:D-3-phosphoglycerate dehydrogenase / 2-oxoglutarate reductase